MSLKIAILDIFEISQDEKVVGASETGGLQNFQNRYL